MLLCFLVFGFSNSAYAFFGLPIPDFVIELEGPTTISEIMDRAEQLQHAYDQVQSLKEQYERMATDSIIEQAMLGGEGIQAAFQNIDDVESAKNAMSNLHTSYQNLSEGAEIFSNRENLVESITGDIMNSVESENLGNFNLSYDSFSNLLEENIEEGKENIRGRIQSEKENLEGTINERIRAELEAKTENFNNKRKQIEDTFSRISYNYSLDNESEEHKTGSRRDIIENYREKIYTEQANISGENVKGGLNDATMAAGIQNINQLLITQNLILTESLEAQSDLIEVLIPYLMSETSNSLSDEFQKLKQGLNTYRN